MVFYIDLPLFDQIKEMDPIGTFLVLPAAICLLLALQWAGTTYPWKSGRTIALLILGVFLLACFAVVQYRNGEHGTVPLRVAGNRNTWGSAIFGTCVMAAFFTMLYCNCYHIRFDLIVRC